MTTTICPGPRSTDSDGLDGAIESHPIWTELRGPLSTAITGGLGTATPASTFGYDPATGLPTTVTAGGVTVTTGYDSLGQANTYTDADSNSSSTGHDLDGRPTAVFDGKGTSTTSYDGTDASGNTEHRGLATQLVDSTAGTFTAAYNDDSNITTEVYPSGLTATWTYDNNGDPTSLTYAKSGTTWQTYTATYSAQDQIVQANGPLTKQHYAYDADSRLTQTQDLYSGSCTTRDYTYDLDTNRSTLIAHPATSGTTCSDSTTPTSSVSHSYNTGDQLTDPGYSYDAYGRTLTVPATDLTGTGSMSLGYYTDDMVASETQNGATDSFTLDPLQNRVRTETSSASDLTMTNHYFDSSDGPAWTANGDGTWTRDISGLDGNLAGTQSSDGTITLELPDLHGDIGATAPDSSSATGVSATYAYTEFGGVEPGGASAAQYGALGAAQRSSGDVGGLTIMGQRLYDPNSGRFLQVDPVLGGNSNPYDYVGQDPQDATDLTGRTRSFRECLNAGCLSITLLAEGNGGWTLSIRVTNSPWRIHFIYAQIWSWDFTTGKFQERVLEGTLFWGTHNYNFRPSIRGRDTDVMEVFVQVEAFGIEPWDESFGEGWVDSDLF